MPTLARNPFPLAIITDFGYRDHYAGVMKGVVATIADSACGYAAYSLMPADASVLTVEYKINLLAPAVGDRFIARATVIRPGRTLTVVEADVFASVQGEERRTATMLATIIAVRDRPDRPT